MSYIFDKGLNLLLLLITIFLYFKKNLGNY